MELREKIVSVLVADGACRGWSGKPTYALADRILALPEIKEALEEAQFNRVFRKSGGRLMP